MSHRFQSMTTAFSNIICVRKRKLSRKARQSYMSSYSSFLPHSVEILIGKRNSILSCDYYSWWLVAGTAKGERRFAKGSRRSRYIYISLPEYMTCFTACYAMVLDVICGCDVLQSSCLAIITGLCRQCQCKC